MESIHSSPNVRSERVVGGKRVQLGAELSEESESLPTPGPREPDANALSDAVILEGLCRNCALREVCVFRVREGGARHCGKYE